MENKPSMADIIQKKIKDAQENNQLKDVKAPEIKVVNSESLKADSKTGF